VWPSATNFLLARPARTPARAVYEGLKERRILVRYFDKPGLEDCLRISVGSDAETAAFVSALEGMLR
jgi:histidinol-phosphate aminotransferase